MADGTDWFRESFRTEFDKQTAAIGRFNLAIFGKTGVGKSTLINAIFGEEVARVGIGSLSPAAATSISDKIGHLGHHRHPGPRGRQGQPADPGRSDQGDERDAASSR